VAAVAAAVLKSLLEDGWFENCQKMGEYFKGRLIEMQARFPLIKEVRGLGLILGMEIDRPGAPIVRSCIEKGFLINCVQDKVLRFLPPLIVGKAEINALMSTLDQIFREI
jgi:acetylornithine/N-succinyldiaminopimelate aminotransferase